MIADRTTQTGSHSDPHLPVLKSLGNSPRAGARRRSPGLGGPVTMETYPDGGTWFQLCIVGEDVLAQVVAREKTTHCKKQDKQYTEKLGYIEHLQRYQLHYPYIKIELKTYQKKSNHGYEKLKKNPRCFIIAMFTVYK